MEGDLAGRQQPAHRCSEAEEGTRTDRERPDTCNKERAGGRAQGWAGVLSLGIHRSGAKQLVGNKNKHQGYRFLLLTASNRQRKTPNKYN